jgi:hypothetical protein
MKKITKWLEERRIAGPRGELAGAFVVPSPSAKGWYLEMIVSDGMDWDHVSVKAADPGGHLRTPTWDEMVYVKDLWFKQEECALQYHPAKKDYVNCHPHVLHLWRPQKLDIPMPPKVMV